MSEEKVEQIIHSVIVIDITRVLAWSGKTIRVFGTLDHPWFHGADLAKALGYANTTDGIGHAKSHQKCIGNSIIRGRDLLPLNRYDKTATFVNEGGLYAMIFKSKKKEAEAFQDWVTDEVLPSIRKTGEFRVNAQLQSLQSELSNQRLLTDQSTRIVEEQKKLVEDANVKIVVEQKRIEDLRVQAEIDRLRAEDEKKALTLKHETEQKQKDEQLAIQREALKLKHETCKKWEEKAINRDPPPKVHFMYIASTTQYMLENCFKVGGVECEAALPSRLNLYSSGHTESDPFFYVWRAPCYNFRTIESEFWTINEQFRDKIGTKKEMIRMKREDIIRDLGRIMSRIELTVNECVREYPETMRRAIEENGPVYSNIDEPKVKKIPKIDIAATAEIDTVKKELMKHIATRYPNYVFETDKNTTGITIEWKVIAPSFDIYTGTRTHWCKLTKSALDGTQIVFIPRGIAPTP